MDKLWGPKSVTERGKWQRDVPVVGNVVAARQTFHASVSKEHKSFPRRWASEGEGRENLPAGQVWSIEGSKDHLEEREIPRDHWRMWNARSQRERETNWEHAEMAARQRHHWWVMRDQDFETCRQLTSGNSRLGWIIHSNGGLICQFNSLVNGHNTVSLNEGNTRSHSATSVTHSRRVEKTLKKVTLSEQCCTQSPQVLQLTSTGGN